MKKPFIIINRNGQEMYTMKISEADAKKIFTSLANKRLVYYQRKSYEILTEPLKKIEASKRAMRRSNQFMEEEFVPGLKSTNSILRVKISENITETDFYENGYWDFFENLFKEFNIEYVNLDIMS